MKKTRRFVIGLLGIPLFLLLVSVQSTGKSDEEFILLEYQKLFSNSPLSHVYARVQIEQHPLTHQWPSEIAESTVLSGLIIDGSCYEYRNCKIPFVAVVDRANDTSHLLLPSDFSSSSSASFIDFIFSNSDDTQQAIGYLSWMNNYVNETGASSCCDIVEYGKPEIHLCSDSLFVTQELLLDCCENGWIGTDRGHSILSARTYYVDTISRPYLFKRMD